MKKNYDNKYCNELKSEKKMQKIANTQCLDTDQCTKSEVKENNNNHNTHCKCVYMKQN